MQFLGPTRPGDTYFAYPFCASYADRISTPVDLSLEKLTQGHIQGCFVGLCE